MRYKQELTIEEKHKIEEIRTIVPVIGDTVIKQSFEILLQKIGDLHDQN